eukprot:TRINITY_DN271_c0_g1_i1.p1 TRINITY_DN271_c0_g1~~TRINITY_DN271_c0_g1_i1.p1  ORF type:complete len:375 (+),score=69.65 TRINITY_DN271_c0_g1_i1:126-1250(+)
MPKKRVFGTSLEKILASEELQPNQLPAFVESSLCMLRSCDDALTHSFELPANSEEVSRLYSKVSSKKAYANLAGKYSPAAVIAVLRIVLAEIKAPCVPGALHPEFLEADRLHTTSSRVSAIALSVQHLPPAPLVLLTALMDTLSRGCDPGLIAARWAPLIFRSSSDRLVGVTLSFLDSYQAIFHGNEVTAATTGSSIATSKRPAPLVLGSGQRWDQVPDGDSVTVYTMPPLGTPLSAEVSPLTPLCLAKPELTREWRPPALTGLPSSPANTTNLLRVPEYTEGKAPVGNTSFAFNPLDGPETSDDNFLQDEETSSEVSFGSCDDVCGNLGLEEDGLDGRSLDFAVQAGLFDKVPECVRQDIAFELASRLQSPPV